MARIHAVETTLPSHRYDQETLAEATAAAFGERLERSDRLERFHRNVRVAHRHLALPREAYADLTTFGDRNDAWIAAAVDLGERTVREVLEGTAVEASDVDLLLFTTVTGLAVPSVDARLVNRLPLSPHVRRLPLFGLGCAGGAAGLARAADHLAGHPDGVAVLLSVELCSLTLRLDDPSVANLIASGLFGDGAAAAVLLGPDHPGARPDDPAVVASRSVHFPDTERVMGWDVDEGGLEIVLGAEVPAIARREIRPAVEAFLATRDLTVDDVVRWIAHPGGPKVIRGLEDGLDLSADALEPTRESLAAVGNLSSASVLDVLRRVLAHDPPPPGSPGLLLAMGPGFAAELVLLRW